MVGSTLLWIVDLLWTTLHLIAPSNEIVAERQVDLLKQAVEHIEKHASQGLRFLKQDIVSMWIVVFSVEVFANCPDLDSYLGYGTLMAEKDDYRNIDHYRSSTCHRMPWLALPSRYHTLIHAFYVEGLKLAVLATVLKRRVQTKSFLDSPKLFNVVSNSSSQAMQRLLIVDLHDGKAIKTEIWIKSDQSTGRKTQHTSWRRKQLCQKLQSGTWWA